MFFEFGIEEFGQVEFLVAEDIQGCIKVIYFDGIISYNLEVIIRFEESNGFVG